MNCTAFKKTGMNNIREDKGTDKGKEKPDARQVALVRNNRDSLTMLRCDWAGTFLHCVSKGVSFEDFTGKEMLPLFESFALWGISTTEGWLFFVSEWKKNLREKKRANKKWNLKTRFKKTINKLNSHRSVCYLFQKEIIWRVRVEIIRGKSWKCNMPRKSDKCETR